MAVLDDRGVSTSASDADLAPRRPTTPAPEDGIERDYTAHRSAVMAMLRADFPRLRDPEELYQEAWTELLELQARTAEPVRNVRALLKKIAWRRAADTFRRHRPDVVDPSSHVLVSATDLAPQPDEMAQVRLDAEALRLVVESLAPRHAAVLKLRFDLQLSAKEIQDRLGLTPKRLEKVMTEAYKHVLAELQADGQVESPWRRRQRSLLLACEAGIASPEQRRRAQEMVERDAACRAMLREMRDTLRGVAVALPLPIVEDRRARGGGPFEALLSRLEDAWAGVRGTLDDVFSRGASSGAAEGASAGGLAAAAGVTGKVVAACLAAGGTAAVCITALPRPDAERPPRSPAPVARPLIRDASSQRVKPPAPKPIVVRQTAQKSEPKTPSRKATVRRKARPQPAVSSPKSEPAVSPAPVNSVEFGPGDTGSSSAPVQPAAAPPDGGGEFGP